MDNGTTSVLNARFDYEKGLNVDLATDLKAGPASHELLELPVRYDCELDYKRLSAYSASQREQKESAALAIEDGTRDMIWGSGGENQVGKRGACVGRHLNLLMNLLAVFRIA